MRTPAIDKKDFYLALDSLKTNNAEALKDSMTTLMTKSAKAGKLIYSTAPSVKEAVIDLLQYIFNDEGGVLKQFIYTVDFGRCSKDTETDFMTKCDKLYDFLVASY